MWTVIITTKTGGEFKGWVSTRDLPKHVKEYAKNVVITKIKIERASVDVLEVE